MSDVTQTHDTSSNTNTNSNHKVQPTQKVQHMLAENCCAFDSFLTRAHQALRYLCADNTRIAIGQVRALYVLSVHI